MYGYEYVSCSAGVHVKGGLPGCNMPQSETKKNSVDMMMMNILRDLPFSQIQPLKLADN